MKFPSYGPEPYAVSYTHLAQAEEGKLLLVRARLTMPPRWIRRFGKTTIFTFEVADGTGVLDVNIFNLPFLFEMCIRDSCGGRQNGPGAGSGRSRGYAHLYKAVRSGKRARIPCL